jgi:hypothetical protein
MPGVMVYGQTPDEAVARAKALALRVIADRLEHNEEPVAIDTISLPQFCQFACDHIDHALADVDNAIGRAL